MTTTRTNRTGTAYPSVFPIDIFLFRTRSNELRSSGSSGSVIFFSTPLRCPAPSTPSTFLFPVPLDMPDGPASAVNNASFFFQSPSFSPCFPSDPSISRTISGFRHSPLDSPPSLSILFVLRFAPNSSPFPHTFSLTSVLFDTLRILPVILIGSSIPSRRPASLRAMYESLSSMNAFDIPGAILRRSLIMRVMTSSFIISSISSLSSSSSSPPSTAAIPYQNRRIFSRTPMACHPLLKVIVMSRSTRATGIPSLLATRMAYNISEPGGTFSLAPILLCMAPKNIWASNSGARPDRMTL